MFWFEAFHPGTGERLEVEARYHPPRRGERDRLGVPLEPGEREEVVIDKVWNRAGEPVEFDRFEEELTEAGLRAIRASQRRTPWRR